MGVCFHAVDTFLSYVVTGSQISQFQPQHFGPKADLGRVFPFRAIYSFNNGANLLQKTLDKGLMVKVFMTVPVPCRSKGWSWLGQHSQLSLPPLFLVHTPE